METILAEVRQNLIPDSDQFGSVAVRAGDDRWLIGNPDNGAHWAGDREVEGWSVGAFEAPVIPEPAEPTPEPATGRPLDADTGTAQ